MKKTINTEKIKIGKSSEDLYHQFCDFNQIKKLIENENISMLEIKDERCSFMVQNMILVELEYIEKTPCSFIKVAATNSSPIPFSISCNIETIDNNNSSIQVCVEMELNPMMSMMLSGKLNKLENELNEKIRTLYI